MNPGSLIETRITRNATFLAQCCHGTPGLGPSRDTTSKHAKHASVAWRARRWRGSRRAKRVAMSSPRHQCKALKNPDLRNGKEQQSVEAPKETYQVT